MQIKGKKSWTLKPRGECSCICNTKEMSVIMETGKFNNKIRYLLEYNATLEYTPHIKKLNSNPTHLIGI